MQVEVNFLAVFLAMLASMIVGAIWYAKGVFGKKWMGLVKIDEKKMKQQAPIALATAAIASLITAYVLAHVTYISYTIFAPDYSFMAAGLSSAFWMWLGFVGTRFLVHDAFEQRPLKLTVLNTINELLTLLSMGAVIGFMGV